MKILVINPNTTLDMTHSIGEMASKYCNSDTKITAISPEWGPRSIEGHFEEYLSALATVETVAKYKNDYDAFIIACYGDPGVSACREITDKPVIGIGEASMHMACFVGHKFSIVTVIPRIKPLLEDLVNQLGLAAKCASIRATNLSVLEIEQDPERAVNEMINEAKLAIQNDGAEAICLGCAGMGPLDLKVQDAIGIPVFDGTVSALKVAEGLVTYGKKTSKIGAYSWPEKKELVGCSSILKSISE
jgi:allantoin racemase